MASIGDDSRVTKYRSQRKMHALSPNLEVLAYSVPLLTCGQIKKNLHSLNSTLHSKNLNHEMT